MSSILSSSKFDEDSSLAHFRNLHCKKPFGVRMYSTYPTTLSDEIKKTQCSGMDRSRLNEVKKMIDGKGIDSDAGAFESRGGTLVISPPMETVKEHHNFQIHIRENDLVIPICHEGMNRSQVMHLVMRCLKSQVGKNNVSKPHGAEGGFDPYQAYSDLTSENCFGYINSNISPLSESDKTNDWIHKCFYQAFGVEKSARIGQLESTTSGHILNPDEDDMSDRMFEKLSVERTAQRKCMDDLLYNVDNLYSLIDDVSRVIVITFCRATSIFINRLLEVSGDKDLSKIVVVSLPYPDTISSAGGKAQREEYFAKTGVQITRNALNVIAQQETFAFYASLFQLVVKE